MPDIELPTSEDPEAPPPIRIVKAESSDAGRIPFCIRIGVTGHRVLLDIARLTAEVDVAIDDILRRVPSASDPHTESQPTVVTALAEGADRLVAERVLGHPHARLEVVLPMPAADYRQTFSNDDVSSAEKFEELLASAALTLVEPRQIDEGGNEDHDGAFLAAGQRVAKLSDVVIAIWDGEQSHGKGGTGDAVKYVADHRIPLIWLPTDGTHRIVENLGGDPDGGFGALRSGAVTDLEEYNAQELSEENYTESVNSASKYFAARPQDADSLPLEEFIDWCVPYFARADSLANRFQSRYLWTARAIWSFAAAAPLCIAVRTIWRIPTFASQALLAGEIVLLISIVMLYLWGRHQRYNEKWINSRVLSERLRATYYLALANAGDPISRKRPRMLLEDPADSWIRRAISEVWGRRPAWIPADPGDVGPLQRYLARSWISDQAAYHKRTSRRYKNYHLATLIAAGIMFGLGVAAAFSHLLLHRGGSEEAATFVSLAAPVCAAALSGYSSQRDHHRHSLRYTRMATLLAEREQTMGDAPDLATIAAVAADVDRLVREDNGDWFGVVRLHDIELPS